MNPKINLSRIKACNQVWDSMSTCGSGRLCSKCNNVIIDFRGKTDWEIALKHAQSEKKVCGLYDKKSLDQNNDLSLTKSNNKGLLVAGTIGLLSISSPLLSQSTSETKIEVTEIDHHLKAATDSNNKRKTSQDSKTAQADSIMLLKGFLKERSGEPLIGGTILIKGTEKGVVSGIDGNFEIDVTEDFIATDSIVIIASYIGFGREELRIQKLDFNQNKSFNIEMVMDEKQELTSFNVSRPPFYKRVWYGIKNIFKKKQ